MLKLQVPVKSMPSVEKGHTKCVDVGWLKIFKQEVDSFCLFFKNRFHVRFSLLKFKGGIYEISQWRLHWSQDGVSINF